MVPNFNAIGARPGKLKYFEVEVQFKPVFTPDFTPVFGKPRTMSFSLHEDSNTSIYAGIRSRV